MNSVYQIVQQATRKQFVLSLAVAGLVLAAACWNARYLANCFQPPVRMSPTDIEQVQDAGKVWRYRATVRGEESINTGITEEFKEDERVTDTHVFLLMLVNHHLLLVRAEQGVVSGKQYTGTLVPVPDDVQAQVVNKVKRSIPQYDTLILPFMLDAKDGFADNGYWLTAIGGIILLICVWNLLLAMKRRQHPDSHPIMRALARFGPPSQVAAEIEAELHGPTEMLTASLQFTQHWLLQATTTSLGATRLADIVWIYKQVTQHRVNFVPTGKTYAALICDRHNALLTIPGSDEQVNSILQAVAEHAPGVLVGYNKDLEAHWRANRAEVVAAVMKRREEIEHEAVEAVVE